MSNPESFIDEVSDDVRRDRLYALLRRWGWVAVLAVVVLVGGAIWTEVSRSRAETEARAFGDAVLAALENDASQDRLGALAAIEPADEGQAALLALLRAAALQTAEAPEAAEARELLAGVGALDGVSDVYRHLADLKRMLAGGTGDPAEDAALLDALSAPGAPFRALALELRAVAAVADGERERAVELLRTLAEDAESTQGLRRRAEQLSVALGAAPEPS